MQPVSRLAARREPARLESLETRTYLSVTPIENYASEHGAGCGCAGCCPDAGAHDLIVLGEGLEIYHDAAPTEAEINAYLEEIEAIDALGDPAPTSFGLDEIPALSSLPSSKMTIYLDFNGHTTSGTRWNMMYSGGEDFTTPAFSTDSDTSTFSDAEIQRIENIWSRVAEDYAPFDVNVTTVAPPAGDLIDSNGSDDRWGIRVVIGGTYSDWYRTDGSASGGVAFVGSFDWDQDAPVFVFEDALGNGLEKYVAEAVSHEVGHSLGLRHHSTFSSEYYTGHDNWAPIMGNSYYKAVTQWSHGEFNQAKRPTQGDVDILGDGGEGVTFRADDFGDTIDTAFSLPMGLSETLGVITQASDIDFFRIDSGTGMLTLDVQAPGIQPNLDLGLTLLDDLGNELLTTTPTDTLDAFISLEVIEGTYYLLVDGVGTGDGVTGYTDYGSIGTYLVSADVPPIIEEGDITHDGSLDIDDVDRLVEAIANQNTDPMFDLNGDQLVDAGDLEHMINNLIGTTMGDSNLDGVVDLLDLGSMANHFNQSRAAWSSGDFNADGSVDLLDLSLLGTSWQESEGETDSLALHVDTSEQTTTSIVRQTQTQQQRQRATRQVASSGIDNRPVMRPTQSAWITDMPSDEAMPLNLWKNAA